ncbi:MAG: transcriptional repressor [Leptolyngbyaceae cyanobacterium SM1_1_3]|nr:transcriptional repressor [Leptolyngbyaceae cyanobacterium SM1_1_3]NJM85130.1 transcriptional repressor [Leptolyngbyaceae cyanobacterium RM2_2_21]NJN01021.1 transcriptional repressor [Leptolyngbyaceae cyanobacterium RM1_1_2]NJO10209.1 transcriptional repressor [Leptolyngbyaceae cyanobacterium SL_1_1]
MEISEPESTVFQHPEIFRSLLNREGLRFTGQRQKILEVFKNSSVGHHLSAEAIYQQLSEQRENISISTIYRAIHLMVNLQILREIGLAEGKKYYELSTPFVHPHHHLVCVQCGTVQEFEEDLVTAVSVREAENRGFAIADCQFTVFALCPNCQKLHHEGINR